ncbi:MAG: hypothetical protein ABIF18_02305 [archaeon]
MKKALGIFILGIFIISMGAGIVSAGPVEQINSVIKGIYDVFEPLLSIVIGDTQDSTDFFLVKVLFLIIIFAVVWKSLEKISFFSESEWVLWIVSIAVSIISVRWFGDMEVVNSVLLPYSALGITLAAGIPFVLYFLVVENFKKTMRKVSWIFFIVVFIGLWFSRAGEVVNSTAVGGNVGGFAYIYLITAGVAFLVLMFDGTIQKIKNKIKAEKGMSYKEMERKHRVMDDLDKARDLKVDMINRGDTPANIKKADDHIKKLEKSLAGFP